MAKIGRTYDPPSDIAVLDRIDPEAITRELAPTTEVVVVFRGGPQMVDRYGGIAYHIPRRPDGDQRFADWRDEQGRPLDRYAYPPKLLLPASRLRMTYGLARHFQRRAIVPATRDPHRGKAVSQFAIEGLDRPEYCQPFTAAQLEHWKMGEGLDRSRYEDPRKRDVELVQTQDAILSAMAQGLDVEGVMEAGSPPEASAPPETHEALEQIARDTHEYAREQARSGHEPIVSRTARRQR